MSQNTNNVLTLCQLNHKSTDELINFICSIHVNVQIYTKYRITEYRLRFIANLNMCLVFSWLIKVLSLTLNGQGFHSSYHFPLIRNHIRRSTWLIKENKITIIEILFGFLTFYEKKNLI